MNTTSIDPIVRAVLYEGYILYPYRPSSRKNQRERFTFGRVYPRAYSVAQDGSEPCLMQTECLLGKLGGSRILEVGLRFLQAVRREVGVLRAPLDGWPFPGEAVLDVEWVPSATVGGKIYQTWQEAVERCVALAPERIPVTQHFVRQEFEFAASQSIAPLSDEQGKIVAVLRRRSAALKGEVEVGIAPRSAGGTRRVTVRVWNDSRVAESLVSDTDAVLLHTFASTHTLLQAPGGHFLSLTDPEPAFAGDAGECRNIGTWPVLVGDAATGTSDTMLSSPIILYDFPAIAPESATEFCDSTEIDQMLALRVLTMSDQEKREMRDVDPFARRILERSSSLGAEDFLRMHGTMREVGNAEEFFNPPEPVDWVLVKGGCPVRAGDRVRVRPAGRADAIDLLLSGKMAVVEAIEQNLEGAIQVAVVFEDDPGKDFGMKRQPGHRFFYSAEELEAVEQRS